MDIINLIKGNEDIKKGFMCLHSAFRVEYLNYTNKGFFNGMCQIVLLEDVYESELYTHDEFDSYADFIFEPEAQPLFKQIVQEGYILPAFVSNYDLKIGIPYKTRQPVGENN